MVLKQLEVTYNWEKKLCTLHLHPQLGVNGSWYAMGRGMGTKTRYGDVNFTWYE